jgi:hypothetical protein
MKVIYVIPGVVILLVGMFFLYSPSTFGQVAGYAGVQTTTTISSPPDRLIVVPYGNFSFFSVSIPDKGTMTSTFDMNPPGLNIFVMNQGNFTLFTKNQSAFPIRSMFNVSSPASLKLTYNQASTNVTYYFVIQDNNPAKQSSDVLLHYTITSQVSLSGVMYYTLILVIIGIALIALGALPKSKPKEILPPPMPQQKQQPQPQVSTIQQTAAQTPPTRPVICACKFCGATMNPNELFCPSCQRSQQ